MGVKTFESIDNGERMKIASVIYKKVLEMKGARRFFWAKLRDLVVKYWDPNCVCEVHGKKMTMPLSHALPLYYNTHPFYDRLPTRLGKFVRERYGAICCVDVGANIGDTVVALMNGVHNDVFLAIEPNPRFYKLLCENLKQEKNVTTLSVMCSSMSSDMGFVVAEKNGTAVLNESCSADLTGIKALDDIVGDYPEFRKVNLLKIDTDGYDFEVVAGARKLIQKSLPAILFECGDLGEGCYPRDCAKTLEFFKETGYSSFLVYSNLGHLLGRFSIDQLKSFYCLVLSQLTGGLTYFDIVVMQDSDADIFHKSEIAFFIEQIKESEDRRFMEQFFSIR